MYVDPCLKDDTYLQFDFSLPHEVVVAGWLHNKVTLEETQKKFFFSINYEVKITHAVSYH